MKYSAPKEGEKHNRTCGIKCFSTQYSNTEMLLISCLGSTKMVYYSAEHALGIPVCVNICSIIPESIAHMEN
jgi:hypothetical protein